MPFKSKAQQRFMFAAEERGDLPKGTAKRWAEETPNIKKLPEHKKKACLKMAADLGKLHALAEEKTAGFLPLGYTPSKLLALFGPAGIGALLAGEDYRIPGALAGLSAGFLGSKVLKGPIKAHMMRSAEQTAEKLSPIIGALGGATIGGGVVGLFRHKQISDLSKRVEELTAQQNAQMARRYSGAPAVIRR